MCSGSERLEAAGMQAGRLEEAEETARRKAQRLLCTTSETSSAAAVPRSRFMQGLLTACQQNAHSHLQQTSTPSSPARIPVRKLEWYVQVVVHRIFSSCNKSEALLLQPGDSLLLAGEVSTSASGWDPITLSKLLRVLMDDSSKLGCVFRRPERPPGKRQGYVWYAAGVSGCIKC